MSTDTIQSLPDLCDALGLSIEHSAPMYVSPEEAEVNGHGRWNHIKSIVTIKRDGKTVWTGPYHQGLACVAFADRGLQRDHEKGFMSLMHEDLLKCMHTPTCRGLRWRKPTLADVMHSLLLDGSPELNANTFEEWCDEFGMDTDSRKAETQYQACTETGRALRRAFDTDELNLLREASSEF